MFVSSPAPAQAEVRELDNLMRAILLASIPVGYFDRIRRAVLRRDLREWNAKEVTLDNFA